MNEIVDGADRAVDVGEPCLTVDTILKDVCAPVEQTTLEQRLKDSRITRDGLTTELYMSLEQHALNGGLPIGGRIGTLLRDPQFVEIGGTDEIKNITSHYKRILSRFDNDPLRFAEFQERLQRVRRITSDVPADMRNRYRAVDNLNEKTDLFVDKLYTEASGRMRQDIMFTRLVQKARAITTPEDARAIVQAHSFMYSNAKRTEGDWGPLDHGSVLKELLLRVSFLLADEYDGLVDPLRVADFLLPAAEEMILSADEGTDRNNVEWAIRQLFAKRMIGMAEGVAINLMRHKLVQNGYRVSGNHKSHSARFLHESSPKYPSSVMVRHITDQLYGLADSPQEYDYYLEHGLNAAHEATRTIRLCLEELADSGKYPIAQQLLKALEKLRYNATAGESHEYPVKSFFHLANLITPQINQREGLLGEKQLSLLEGVEFSKIPQVFQRLLIAIDPKLLVEALNESILTTNSQLRLRMAYIEMLGIQLSDSETAAVMTVGDAIMRLSSSGMSAAEIENFIRDHQKGSVGKVIGITAIRDVASHWRLRLQHVRYNVSRSGYGLKS